MQDDTVRSREGSNTSCSLQRMCSSIKCHIVLQDLHVLLQQRRMKVSPVCLVLEFSLCVAVQAGDQQLSLEINLWEPAQGTETFEKMHSVIPIVPSTNDR